MKYLLLFLFIITLFNLSAFAQIDSSAWEGKTVLMVVESSTVSNYDFYQKLKKEFSNKWDLTDSIHFVIDTTIKQNLNDLGQDTAVITWKIGWQKIFTNKGCCFSSNPYECLIWNCVETFEIRNFKTNDWEKYIFPFYDKERNNYQKFQQLITNSAYETSYEGKTIIVKNYPWDYKIQLLLEEKCKNSDLKILESFGNEYANYKGNDAIIIYKQLHPKVNFIEIIDLKTNRVIEKIKLPSKLD